MKKLILAGLFALLTQAAYCQTTLVVQGERIDVRDLGTGEVLYGGKARTTVTITHREIIYRDSARVDTLKVISIAERKGVNIYTLENVGSFYLDIRHAKLQFNDPLTNRQVTIPNALIQPHFK